MGKKYDPENWDIDSLLDSVLYTELARHVYLLDDLARRFDEDNETEYSEASFSLAQGAFLMIVVSHMEHHLQKILDVVATKKNLQIRPKDMAGSRGFGQCMKFLNVVLQINNPNSYSLINEIVSVRNVIAHAGGYVNPGKAKDIKMALGELAEHFELAEDGLLQITGPLAQEAAICCRDFVAEIGRNIKQHYERWGLTPGK